MKIENKSVPAVVTFESIGFGETFWHAETVYLRRQVHDLSLNAVCLANGAFGLFYPTQVVRRCVAKVVVESIE